MAMAVMAETTAAVALAAMAGCVVLCLATLLRVVARPRILEPAGVPLRLWLMCVHTVRDPIDPVCWRLGFRACVCRCALAA